MDYHDVVKSREMKNKNVPNDPHGLKQLFLLQLFSSSRIISTEPLVQKEDKL